MIRSLKKIAVILMSVIGISFMSYVGVYAQAPPETPPPAASGNIADNICRGVLSTSEGTVSSTTTISNCQETGNESFSFLARRVINIFSVVVGTVSVIMIIIGGFRYIISGGDSSSVSAAKNTILYAVVGLIIVLFAQVIVRFVVTNVTTIR